jgi:hypothetical protein
VSSVRQAIISQAGHHADKWAHIHARTQANQQPQTRVR